jgi:hypothetical protein
MGAVAGTLVKGTELAGAYKVIQVRATLAALSDTITLTEATHGVKSIIGVLGAIIETGLGANFATLQITTSGLVATVGSFNAAGASATSFGNVLISLLCAV